MGKERVLQILRQVLEHLIDTTYSSWEYDHAKEYTMFLFDINENEYKEIFGDE